MERTSPPGSPRVLVDWTLVVALVTAACTGWAGAAHRPVPPELVGVWQSAAARWTYAIDADGSYRAWPSGNPDAVNTGTVEVDDTTITFSNGGAPVTDVWTATERRLVLDGVAYRRH